MPKSERSRSCEDRFNPLAKPDRDLPSESAYAGATGISASEEGTYRKPELTYKWNSFDSNACLAACRILFEDPQPYSDFKITCYTDEGEEVTFKAHEKIVCPQSEYFTKILTGDFIEAREREIRLVDETPDDVAYMLQFLYMGQYHTRKQLELDPIGAFYAHLGVMRIANKFIITTELHAEAGEMLGIAFTALPLLEKVRVLIQVFSDGSELEFIYDWLPWWKVYIDIRQCQNRLKIQDFHRDDESDSEAASHIAEHESSPSLDEVREVMKLCYEAGSVGTFLLGKVLFDTEIPADTRHCQCGKVPYHDNGGKKRGVFGLNLEI
ncbi:hypothetical protein BJ508DRAFT_325161 [Ascobolus immersus RN42]|uniref:BTB domain-containing protein n=1 Tax=Ascobolus immersus RN42 TaxID=1160509 RepID=A0A3N4IM67_ASCIM|nr:hypothetical protein BJ508DRAFT_325161 [Ascobolus immersus RN42]